MNDFTESGITNETEIVSEKSENDVVHGEQQKGKINRNRNVSITFRCTEKEKKRITENAREAGMNTSFFIVKRCTSDRAVNVEIKPRSNEILEQLRGIGTNLNQIARQLNALEYQDIDHLEKKKQAEKLITDAAVICSKMKKEWS